MPDANLRAVLAAARAARVLRSTLQWQDERVQRAVRVVAQVAEVVVPCTELAVISAGPDDNRILECAVAGKADLIVSNDHHLPIVAGPDFRGARRRYPGL